MELEVFVMLLLFIAMAVIINVIFDKDDNV